MTRFNPFFSIFVFSILFTPHVHSISYGAYGHHNIGVGRALGIAGAYSSLSEDSNSFIFNPAGTGFAAWTYHFEGASFALTNDELDINQDGVGEIRQQNLYLFGAHYKTKEFSLGLGLVEPYSVSLSNKFSFAEKKISLKNFVVNVALCPYEKLCVGSNITSSRATQSFQSHTENLTQDEVQMNYSFGIAFRNDDNYGIGYFTNPKYFWHFDNPKSNYFNSVTTPQRESFGFFYGIKKYKSKFILDWEKINDPGENVYAFESNEYTNLVSIMNHSITLYKMGFESTLFEQKNSAVKWSLGYYKEPSRFNSSLDRHHFCLGLEARLGPALLQVALDQASNFNNSSQTFSLLIDRL